MLIKGFVLVGWVLCSLVLGSFLDFSTVWWLRIVWCIGLLSWCVQWKSAGIGDWNTAKSVGREVCGVPGEVGSGKGGFGCWSLAALGKSLRGLGLAGQSTSLHFMLFLPHLPQRSLRLRRGLYYIGCFKTEHSPITYSLHLGHLGTTMPITVCFT